MPFRAPQPWPQARRHRRVVSLAVGVLGLLVIGTGPGAWAWASPARSTTAPAASSAPMVVVATVFPLAQAVALVGDGHLSVVDATPPATDPRSLRPSTALRRTLQRAPVVFEVGGGFQPAVEAAAGRRRGVVALWPALGGHDPYIWLDPPTMARAAPLIAAALARADPAHRGAYEQGAKDLEAAMSALDEEYRSGLDDCATTTIVTLQPAFSTMASRYGLTDESITPSYRPNPTITASRRRRVIAFIRNHRVPTVFTAPLESSGLARAVARAAGVGTRDLDPIDALTASERGHKLSYQTLMYDDLNDLESVLNCQDGI